MSRPTAKALNVALANKKPSKPKLTQEQKDAAALEKKLSDVPAYFSIDAKRTSKDACVAAANEYGANLVCTQRSVVAITHQLDIEIREHKATAKALKAAQRKLKEAGIA